MVMELLAHGIVCCASRLLDNTVRLFHRNTNRFPVLVTDGKPLLFGQLRSNLHGCNRTSCFGGTIGIDDPQSRKTPPQPPHGTAPQKKIVCKQGSILAANRSSSRQQSAKEGVITASCARLSQVERELPSGESSRVQPVYNV